MQRAIRAFCATVLLSFPALAQPTLPAGYSIVSTTTAATLGVPTPLGGIEFSPDGSTLFLAGAAGTNAGAIQALPVLRSPATNAIVGFGAPALFALAPNVDAGLAIGPAGTLFFAQSPGNSIGEIVGTSMSSFSLPLITASVGGLAFVPPGPSNAGSLLVSGYNAGDVFSVPLTNNGNGFFAPGTPALFKVLIDGSKGLRFVPSGPDAGDLLVASLPSSAILKVEIDPATGTPVGGIGGSQFPVWISGLAGAMGLAFDPLTSDLFVSTYSFTPGAGSLVQISGFAPPPPLTASVASIPTTGAEVGFGIHAGAANAGVVHVLACSASGTAPGFPFGGVVVPLNLDALTLAILEVANTPAFANFVGTTDGFGESTATLATGPGIPPSAVGATVHFAYYAFSGPGFASNAVPLTIVP